MVLTLASRRTHDDRMTREEEESGPVLGASSLSSSEEIDGAGRWSKTAAARAAHLLVLFEGPLPLPPRPPFGSSVPPLSLFPVGFSSAGSVLAPLFLF